jgi:hypothetical protein
MESLRDSRTAGGEDNFKLEISNLKGEANGIDATLFRVDGIGDEFPG